MRIGELSSATGIPVRTIRYYEQIGLLPEPARTSAGYRVFGDQNVQHARFIRRSRRLGFSLDQIRSILEVTTCECSPCESVRSIAQENIHTIDRRIAELTAMRDLLGQTLEELDLRGSYGVTPLFLRRRDKVLMNPHREERLEEGDELTVAGRDDQLERLEL